MYSYSIFQQQGNFYCIKVSYSKHRISTLKNQDVVLRIFNQYNVWWFIKK